MSRSAQLFSTHGRSLLEIALVSVVGIIATAGFQIVTSRGLGPETFGLLASYLALINVASIGSSALRSSIAVGVAASIAGSTSALRRRFDSSLVEALVLGALGTVLVLVAAPFLATSLDGSVLALVVTAVVITPYFLFSRAQGQLQGIGDSRSVVWWSTGAQVAQLALTVLALLLGTGATGVLLALLVTAVAGVVGSTMQARRIRIPSASRPFTTDSMVVLLLTIAFAWLTNADIIYVRDGTGEEVAGAFAAAAVLVKTTLILPSMLSLYLLPRFVRRKGNSSLTRLGVNVTLAITLIGGLLILGVLTLFGAPIVTLLFGDRYTMTADILPVFVLAWLPWALAQAMLVRITAAASRTGLGVLLICASAQWLGAQLLLPDLTAMIVINGVIGTVVLVTLFGIHLLRARRDDITTSD